MKRRHESHLVMESCATTAGWTVFSLRSMLIEVSWNRGELEAETDHVRQWALGFASADELALTVESFPGFGEQLCRWRGVARGYRTALARHDGLAWEAKAEILARLEELDAALAAVREPFDRARPEVRGWQRLMRAAQELVTALPAGDSSRGE